MLSSIKRSRSLCRRFTSTSARFASSTTNFDETYDYIVLGGGSAGSVITHRLAESRDTKVCLIEAGSWDRNQLDSWKIQMPSALTYNVSDDKCNWNFFTTPQAGLNNRRIHQPRGKVLGGSSCINAMVYARGHACDFDRWARKESCPGWSYSDVLPYFKRAQRHCKGANAYRGASGPLDVKMYDSDAMTNELFRTFVAAGGEAGYPVSDDLNGRVPEGFGPFDMTISPDGSRCSASNAYLHSSGTLKQPNVTLKLDSLCSKIIFDGKDAVGVEIIPNSSKNAKNSTPIRIGCNAEVIVCLGSIGSPQLLMLSGLGRGDELRAAGVLAQGQEPVLDQPDVGRNLQDHLEVYLQYFCNEPVTLFPYGNWSLRHFHRRAFIGIEWFLRGTGICASNQFESGAFIRTDAGVEHPDIQYHFIPGAVVGQAEFVPHHAFQVHVGTLRARARGSVKLASGDPRDAPLIDPNYFDPEFEDLEDMRKAARLADEIVQQDAFRSYKGGMLRPDPAVDGITDLHDGKQQNRFDEWIRNSSHSAYHPSCTLAMGNVVDTEGKVNGVRNLRVCDASIMPSITSGNLNAPTIMMAEKVSDAIRGREPLKSEQVEVYVMPEWKDKQR